MKIVIGDTSDCGIGFLFERTKKIGRIVTLEENKDLPSGSELWVCELKCPPRVQYTLPLSHLFLTPYEQLILLRNSQVE